mgnify:CR=1 FL=1
MTFPLSTARPRLGGILSHVKNKKKHQTADWLRTVRNAGASRAGHLSRPSAPQGSQAIRRGWLPPRRRAIFDDAYCRVLRVSSPPSSGTLISDTTPAQVRHMSLRAHRAARHACLRHACLHRVCLRRACLRDAYEGKLATFLSLDNNNRAAVYPVVHLQYTLCTRSTVRVLSC